MTWKFSPKKEGSSYHNNLVRKQLIDIAVNCVNLVAAAMLMYVIISYIVQGGTQIQKGFKKYPNGESFYGKQYNGNEIRYNTFLADLYNQQLEWNTPGYVYSPEDMPSYCKLGEICLPLLSPHDQLGDVHILPVVMSNFGFFQCPHGALWNRSETAYGYWKCTSHFEHPSWSSLPEELFIHLCGLANPHFQFLKEVAYHLKHSAFHGRNSHLPRSPGKESVHLSVANKNRACDAALELLEIAANETVKHMSSRDDTCFYLAHISSEILTWIGDFCKWALYTDDQYEALFQSLRRLSQGECTDLRVSADVCCVMQSRNSFECSSTCAYSSVYGHFNFFDSFGHKILTSDETEKNNALVVTVSFIHVPKNVSDDIVRFKSNSDHSTCNIIPTHTTFDINLISNEAVDGFCYFNISTFDQHSFLLVVVDKDRRTDGNVLRSIGKRTTTMKAFMDDLEIRFQNELIRQKKIVGNISSIRAKSSYKKLQYYPFLSLLGLFSYILALTCYLATLATYGLFPNLRTERNSTKIKILLALCTCATLYIVSMCLNLPFVVTSSGCEFALVMRVYLTLVTLTWSSIGAFFLYSAIVITETYETNFLRKALIVGLGVPAAIVFIPVSVSADLFKGTVLNCEWVCTLPPFTRSYLFLLPIAVAVTLNAIIYCMAANFYWNSCSRFDVKYEQRKYVWNEIKSSFGLFVLLTTSWIFSAYGVVNWSNRGPVLESSWQLFSQIGYIISIAFQGVYVFVAYCMIPLDARKQWLQIWRSLYFLRLNDFFERQLRKNRRKSPGSVHPSTRMSFRATNVRDRNISSSKRSSASVKGKAAVKKNSSSKGVPKITISSDQSSQPQTSINMKSSDVSHA